MNVLVFQDKKFSGGIQEVISQIQAQFASMLKYVDVPEYQVEEKNEALKKEEKSLGIKLRNCQDEEKAGLKQKLGEVKSQIQKLQSIIIVKQKIEELSNFATSSGASQTVDDVQIQVFEIVVTPKIPSPRTSPLPKIEDVKGDDVKEPIIDSSKTSIQRQCEEYMTFAKQMPECFEKSLIRICYCLSLLQTVSQEGPEAKVEEGVLFIETKEKTIALLKEDWSKVKQQMSDEKIEDVQVDKQLKEMIEYFTNTHPMDYNYEYLNNLLNLLQKVRPFNFQEFFHLISKCETNSERINNKDIVLLLGTTGAGKSTTIQYLYGAQMGKSKDGHIQAAVMPKQLEDFVSSAAMCSITRYINPLHVNYVNEDEEEESFEIVDTPGFGDTQSVEVDISNTIGIIRSVTKANKVYPVFLFSEKNVGGRAEIMKGLINFYSCLIKEMSKNVKSCNFFFSHFSDKNKDMEEFLKSIIKHLNPQEHSNPILKDVLRHMRDLGSQKKLLILDPLDGKHKKVLKQILETDAISNPRNKFSLNIVERSRNFLDKQVQLHEKAILGLVSKGNTELSLWKIEELIKLNEIFIQFEPTYKDSLKSLISQIMSQVNKIIDTVLERIQICLKGSNELYDTDIAKFQEALSFEKKIMPLIARIRTLDAKSGEKDIFSDQQKQSQLISAITSQCELTISQLDKSHEINEDEWIQFITKAIKLSQSISGFEQIEKNCLNKFTEKFQKFAQTAKKIINQAQITDYATLAQYQTQSSNEDGKKSKASFKSKKQFEEDSEGIKTDSDLDQTNSKQKLNNPQILSSSDSQEEIQSDQGKMQAIHQNNKSNDREKPMHNKFKEVVAILVQSNLKIRIVKNKEFQDNLEKTIKEVIFYVENLEEKVKPHFRFFQQGSQEVFQILSQDDVQKVKQSLTMLESYNNACQNIDKNIQQKLERLFEKYKGKCKSLFDVHNQKFLEIAQQQDTNKADEIKMRYDQILLLIQIQQIEQVTSTHFQFIKVWLQNKIQFSTTEIESILQQFGNQTSNDQGSQGNTKGTQPQIKRLKEALTSLKILSETQKEGDQFIKSKYSSMQECFDKLIHKLYQDASQFSNLSQESPQNILPIANIFEQIEEIYLAADIINIKKNLKQDVGIEWIESLKSTLSRIQTESEKLNDVFMKQKDYRNYDLFYNYLKNFTDGQNLSCSQILLKKVNNLRMAENQPKIDPQSIISNLKGYLQDQAEKKITVFESLFSQLQDITSVGPSEISDSEESKEQNFILLQDQVGDEMKKITAQIIELFKIEYDVKGKYPHLSQQVLDSLSNNEDEYFLKHYTNKFRSDYFSNLEKNKISIRSTKWIFLKLQSIKYLRELDEYLYNLRGKSTVKDIYQILDDRYYQDPSSEVSKAKENFTKSSFQEIKEQLDQLSQFINENNNQIKSKIITYLNQQIFSKYEQIVLYQSHDFTLNLVQIQNIASNIEQLLKIDQELEQYIQIQGQKVKEVIEKDVLSYLQSCFNSFSTQIDKYLTQRNFSKAYEKIEEANSLFKQFHRLVGIDARKTQAFIELTTICTNISQKIASLKESIENLFQKILSSKSQDFNYKFNPKIVIENISKITDAKIIHTLQEFEQQLNKQYQQELRDISKIRENTKDLSELKNCILNIETLKDSFQFLPDQISEVMIQKLDSEKTQIQGKIKEIQSREITKFKSELINAEKALDLAHVLNQNKRIIDEDLKDYITIEVSQKLNAFLTKCEQKLLNQQIDEIIQNYVPTIQEFFDQPLLQYYINQKQLAAYTKLLEQINSSVKNAIGLLSKYFVETHQNTTGEPIQVDIAQLIDEKHLKVQISSIKAVCQILVKKSKLAELFKFDETLKTFVEDSTSYIRKIKGIHRATLKQNMKENMAAVSNFRFTTLLILNQQDFKDLISKLNELFEDKVKEFNEEIQEYNFKSMQEESIGWLQQLKKILWDQEFIDKNRSQVERADFYKNVQTNFELIDQAQHIDSLMIPALISQNKSQKSIPFKIKEEFYSKLKENIQILLKDLDAQAKLIKVAKKENNFDVLYSSLKSMSDNLPIVRKSIEQAINNSEQEIKDYLNQLIGKARKSYQNEQTLDLKGLSSILVDIQNMKVNYILFDALIQGTLDAIFEDYSKYREKDSQAAINLQNYLRGVPGPEGTLLAQTHSYFQGTNILKANELFQKKSIDEVIQLLDGTDLAENEKNQLVQYYDQYLFTYQSIIEDKLIVRTDRNGERIPIDLNSIISNIKSKYTSEDSKKWNEKDIFGDIKFGQSQTNMKKLPVLLAHIFSLWSLINSDYYLKQEKTEGQNKQQLQNYLLQPHPAQIVSILRMLGVGYSKQFNIGEQIGKFVNFIKHFGSGQEDTSTDMRNNLVQIRTGEGKSVVLAIVSIVFALNGFEVNCACYSNYLSERDYNDFQKLFNKLGVTEYIKYGTFNEIAEYKINRECNIRESIMNLVIKQEFQKSNVEIKERIEIRPEVLLIDEVDVFFSDQFFGNTYNPQALIQHDKISALIDLIWKNRQSMVKSISMITLTQNKNLSSKDANNKKNQAYMSLRALKNTEEYKAALNIFKPEFQFLVEEATKKMIIDVVDYKSESHKYVVHKDEIGYHYQDQISTNQTHGYKTLFAYYEEEKNQKISSHSLKSKKAIGVNCASFSYAEVPLDYQIILGVTGTLLTLSQIQKTIIENLYNIQHHTISPSVHLSDDTEARIFNPSVDTLIFKSKEYYSELVKMVNTKYIKHNRPVIIFFETDQKLKEFIKLKLFSNYQTLTEVDNNKEKESKILKATQVKQITLTTRIFGRGTDFRCYDKLVIEAAGLVVVQTFLSQDQSEEIQIRGRTGRQGTEGKYILFLNKEGLSDFAIQEKDIKGSKDVYKTLCKFRSLKLDESQKQLLEFRGQILDDHKNSNKMVQEVIKLAKNQYQYDPNKITPLKEFLFEQNKGITLETDDLFMKVLILIDCTGSMGATLQKTKNCVRAMIEEARAELRKNHLSDELILIKIGGYRNYSSFEEQLFQVSPDWEHDPQKLTKFLDEKLQTSGGQGNEAMEIGFSFANKEIQNEEAIPLSMVIVIGDAAPNTPEEVIQKRNGAAQCKGDPNYWQTTNYKNPTNWEIEINQIKAAGVPVYSFYIDKNDRKSYDQLAVSGGKSAFLDITSEAKGQQQLKDFFKYLIVFRVMEINRGQEEALKSVQDIKVSFN